jgi:hypothetical protein
VHFRIEGVTATEPSLGTNFPLTPNRAQFHLVVTVESLVFTLLETRRDIAKAQRHLEAAIRRDFVTRAVKSIGYPGGTRLGATVLTDGNYWFWSQDNKGRGIANPRRLNWFGLFRDDRSLHITVEVNVAYEGRNNDVAGFFARDTDTGLVYLFHSGRLGGGTSGIGKLTFLAWCNIEGSQRPVEVADSTGGIREGLLVMPITGLAATRPAVRYVNIVARFKGAVRAGGLETPELRRKQHQLRDYYAEARGRRKGLRPTVIDYLSRHGEVIDELRLWRDKRPVPKGARFVKNDLVDLGVTVDEALVEVYEAKTNVMRSAIYSAIGQLMVHGATEPCRRVLVLPQGHKLSDDIGGAIRRLKIEILRYTMDENSVTIL